MKVLLDSIGDHFGDGQRRRGAGRRGVAAVKDPRPELPYSGIEDEVVYQITMDV